MYQFCLISFLCRYAEAFFKLREEEIRVNGGLEIEKTMAVFDHDIAENVAVMLHKISN
jgi:hypothetical protein